MRLLTVRAAVVIASLLCLTSFANAGFMSGDIIRLGDAPGGLGGLFDVKKPGSPTVLFQSFCAHVEEDLDFETNYKAILSDVTDPDDRPVGPQAAWLYTQFVRQDTTQLPGFNFDRTTPSWNNNTGANNQARALQLGIWLGMGFTENEIKFNADWTTSEVNNLKTTYLNTWLANYQASGWGQNNYIGYVKILNLYGRDRNGEYTINVQDQLYVPEPGMALLVGTLLLSGAFVRRSRPVEL